VCEWHLAGIIGWQIWLAINRMRVIICAERGVERKEKEALTTTHARSHVREKTTDGYGITYTPGESILRQ